MAAKQIKGLWVFADGTTGYSVICRSGEEWNIKATGSFPDGTKGDFFAGTDVYSDNGKTLTSKFSLVIDGEKTDLPINVSHRVGD